LHHQYPGLLDGGFHAKAQPPTFFVLTGNSRIEVYLPEAMQVVTGVWRRMTGLRLIKIAAIK